MMSNPTVGTARWLTALLGVCFVLLSSIILFVVAVEYDPTGKRVKEIGTSGTGSVISLHPPQVEVGGSVLNLERAEGHWKLAEQQVIYGYYDEGVFMGESTMPHAPRDASDVIIPLLCFLISAVMISCDPRVLYVDGIIQ